MSAMWKLVRLVVAAAMLASLVPAAAFASGGETPAPPVRIRVIVTRASHDGGAERAVAAVGGRIVNDLRIIDSFAADVPGWAVDFIAKNPAVSHIAIDRPVGGTGSRQAAPAVQPLNYYIGTLGAKSVWTLVKDAAGQPVDGRGVCVAVLDSGISSDADLDISHRYTFNPDSTTANDVYGHGTHVAGIVAGKGVDSGRTDPYCGVAPGASLLGLKVADEKGYGNESDVVAALQFVYENAAKYNIRVVNLSINCGEEASYHQSALDAACEILWFNEIVVVCSAGNSSAVGETYNTANSAPANDPFVITVGATSENGTSVKSDDKYASFSMRATTSDGFRKPEIVAPGTDIYSVLSKSSDWGTLYPDRVSYGGEYFRLSGTSMAAPMVAGTAALMLQKDPRLTPDQVKYRPTHACDYITGPDGVPVPYLATYKAVTATSTASANTDIAASSLLWTGDVPVLWDSVMWRSVMWRSVDWNSVMWRSVMWRSAYWGPTTTTSKKK